VFVPTVHWARLLGCTSQLHRNLPWPYCMLCSLDEPTDWNHLGQCTALSNKTECERYWEARTKKMENWLCYFIITILLFYYYYFFSDYPLALGLYVYPECFLFYLFFFVFLSVILFFSWSHRSMINTQCTSH